MNLVDIRTPADVLDICRFFKNPPDGYDWMTDYSAPWMLHQLQCCGASHADIAARLEVPVIHVERLAQGVYASRDDVPYGLMCALSNTFNEVLTKNAKPVASAIVHAKNLHDSFAESYSSPETPLADVWRKAASQAIQISSSSESASVTDGYNPSPSRSQ